jgi:two-component system nitrate/nitrite response regulator NarL
MRDQSTGVVIRVLVADDTRIHTQLLADALRRDGALEVISSDSDARALIARADLRNIDVLLVSSNLDEEPGCGLEVLRAVRTSHSDIRAVMLLDSSKPESVLEAFRAGARGVVSRHESVDTLARCVRKVHDGQIWANSQQTTLLVQALASSNQLRAVDARGLNLLSKREMEVVRYVAQGLTNREIAEELGLSQHTIKNYLFRLFDKLGVSSRVELLSMTLSRDHQTNGTLRGALENRIDGGFPDEAALAACQKAAEQGVLMAQLTLAQFYSARMAGPGDAVQARMWYSVASEQLARASKDAAKGMGMDQVLQAEQMAVNWLNKSRKLPPVREKVASIRVSETARLLKATGTSASLD